MSAPLLQSQKIIWHTQQEIFTQSNSDTLYHVVLSVIRASRVRVSKCSLGPMQNRRGQVSPQIL